MTKDDLAEMTGHSTTTDAAKTALDANAQALIIGHFSARYKDIDPLVEEAGLSFLRHLQLLMVRHMRWGIFLNYVYLCGLLIKVKPDLFGIFTPFPTFPLRLRETASAKQGKGEGAVLSFPTWGEIRKGVLNKKSIKVKGHLII